MRITNCPFKKYFVPMGTLKYFSNFLLLPILSAYGTDLCSKLVKQQK